MGIKGLAIQLHQYCKTTIWPYIADPESRVPAIIDGPSLAHRLYTLRKGKNGTTDSIIFTNADCRAIGKNVIDWLDELQTFNFEIEGIYFDGALPRYKRETRHQRMQIYINNMINIQKNHNRTTRARPPPPFLVFLVVEALFASKYADKTWLVNGEADPYCAAAAQKAALASPENGGIIFTDDSDLLVFNFQAPVRIAMLNAMDDYTDTSDSGLHLHEFNSMAIHEREPDLLGCAYQIEKHSCMLPEARQRCKAGQFEPEEYEAFRDLYDISRWSEELQQLRISRREGQVVLQLDSRVSEPIHQVRDLLKSSARAHGSTDAIEELEMYLPFLLDDPSRSTAWKIGADYREVAQLLILLASPSAALLEYKRSGVRVVSNRIEKASVKTINDKLQHLAQQLQSITAYADGQITSRAQRMFIMEMTVAEMDRLGIPLPRHSDTGTVIDLESPNTWKLVHLWAQFEAQYYSCRILQQVWKWWTSEGPANYDVVLPDDLYTFLNGLASLIDFFDRDATEP